MSRVELFLAGSGFIFAEHAWKKTWVNPLASMLRWISAISSSGDFVDIQQQFSYTLITKKGFLVELL
jgi:hypothetical protein